MIEHNFKKKFGQNFLSDKNLLQAIMSDSGVNEKDNVLEIGAGAGALTQELDKKAKRVVSYEIDEDLKERLLELNLKNTEFVFADALKQNIEEIEGRFGGENYKLVANLPYYITTPLLFKFLEESKHVQSLTIMVQKEVAERMVAKPGGKDYGVLTVMINFFGQAKITRNVGRQMFNPQPNVDSAVVNITKSQENYGVDRSEFYEFVKTCFSMRRKTLGNNLSRGYKLSKGQITQLLGDETAKLRAETLSLNELMKIFKALKSEHCRKM